MSSMQKVIKYLAIAFAMFLTFNILFGIMSGLFMVGNMFNDKEESSVMEKVWDIDMEREIQTLKINLHSSNIYILIGDTFKVETSDSNILCQQDNQSISLIEKENHWFDDTLSKVIIYVPEQLIFDKVDIQSGAGVLQIEKLSTKVLNLDLGAGKVIIHNLQVSKEAEIDGGAGEVIIDSSSFYDLDLSMGVGKFSLIARLDGDTEIDHGVGEADVLLIGTENDYQVHVDKGIGNVTVDGKKVDDDVVVGNGDSKVDIDGGIGNIKIEFRNDY